MKKGFRLIGNILPVIIVAIVFLIEGSIDHSMAYADGETNSISAIAMVRGSSNVGYAYRHYMIINNVQVIAYCSDHNKVTLQPGTVVTASSRGKENLSDDMINKMKKVLYYGYGGEGSITGLTDDDFLLTSFALSYVKNNDSNAGTLTKAYADKLLGMPEVPDSFKLTFWYSGQDSLQELVTTEVKHDTDVPDEPKTVHLKINKYGNATGTATVYRGGVFQLYDENRKLMSTIADTSKAGQTPEYLTKNTVLTEGKKYMIKEIKAPYGCVLPEDNETWFTIPKKAGDPYTVNVTDTSVYSNLKFVKTSDYNYDSVGKTSGQGEYYVEEYSVHDNTYRRCCRVNYNGDNDKNKSSHNVYSLSINVPKLQYGWSNGKAVVMDEISRTTNVNSKLYYTPHNLGKFRLVEENAPKGYEKSEPLYFTISDSAIEVKDLSKDWNVNEKNTGLVYDTPKYFLIAFDKRDEYTNELLENVEFEVQELNNDKWSKVADVGTNTDDEIQHKYISDKLYYTEDNKGRFRLVETKALDGYFQIEPIEFTMDITKDSGYIYEISNGEVYNTPIPYIHTNAKDNESNANEARISTNTTIVDTVSYYNLPYGDYRMEGVSMDKSAGEALEIQADKVISKENFSVKEHNGKIDIKFTFDSSSLEGKDIVVYEVLYSSDEVVAKHKDINDMGQSISFMVEETTEETTIGETTKETTTIGETTVQETTIVETTKTATKGELETKVLGEKMDRTTPGENEEQPPLTGDTHKGIFVLTILIAGIVLVISAKHNNQ